MYGNDLGPDLSGAQSMATEQSVEFDVEARDSPILGYT